MLRASRSIRVTMSTSPLRMKSSTVRNSSRPAVVVPLRFSARMTSQPAALNAGFRQIFGGADASDVRVALRIAALLHFSRGTGRVS
jgi:hypothetical protein